MLRKLFLLFISAIFFAVPAMACQSNEIDVLGDGTQCETSKFEITTTNLNANTDFKFKMSAAGVFYVDWGDGTVDIIDRTGNNTQEQYTHTYTVAGAKTIKFSGRATGYSDASANANSAAIRFGIQYAESAETQNTPNLIASISGSLGEIFPTLNNGADNYLYQPRFSYTFAYTTNMTQIPSSLFDGVFGRVASMFSNTFFESRITSIPSGLFKAISGNAPGLFDCTFQRCTQLTSIPSGLFSAIQGSKLRMFNKTFEGCKKITSIPENLFSGVTGAAPNLFERTFYDCTKLESIPSGLFSGVSGKAGNLFANTFTNCKALTSIPAGLFSGVSGGAGNMFTETFYGCSNLTSIPENLFSGVDTAATSMFNKTFRDCTALTTIPAGLFSEVTGAAENMFNGTFLGCTSLTSIPENLFSKISNGESSMFYATFSGCTSLSGYIPPSTFSGLIANGSQTATDMWTGTFTGTQLASSCPSGKTQYTTGYEDYWNSKVSCVDENLTCDAGEYFAAHGYECTQCPENSYCPGGTYPYSESLTQGITACDAGYFSVAGSAFCTGNTITVTWDGADEADITANNAGTVIYGGDIRTPKKAQHINGKVFVGWKFDDPQQ